MKSLINSVRPLKCARSVTCLVKFNMCGVIGPFFFAIQFDWEGDMPLKLSQKDLVIYEMHVRGFTRHESSNIEFPGTYQGVAEKLDHLQVL